MALFSQVIFPMRNFRRISHAYVLPMATGALTAPIIGHSMRNNISSCNCEVDRTVPTLKSQPYLITGHHRHLRDFDEVYDTIDLLGRGGFAEVWRVRDKETGEYRAAKFVKIHDTHDLNRFKNEVEILTQLDSPLTTRLIEYYSPDGDGDTTHGVIVYHLIEGVDLLDYINTHISSGEGIQHKLVKSIVKEMLRCLDYIHQRGILHRDVKPENFILSESSDGKIRIALIDFGLADDGRSGSTSCYDRMRVGASVYMAPETWDNCYSNKSDVWSVGVILLTILSEGTASLQTLPTDDLNRESLMGNLQNDLRMLYAKGVDHGANILLHQLLTLVPQNRPAASEAAVQAEFMNGQRAQR